MDRTPVNLDTVCATLHYLRSSERRPVTYMLAPPGGHAWETADYGAMAVTIRNGRAAPQAPKLEREGFMLLQAPSAMTSFNDRAAIEHTYYGEMAELALAATGASHAIVFDHLVRRRAPGSASPFGARDGRRPGVATRVHSDYTSVSAQRRLALELDRLGIGAVARYAIVNLWRSTGLPVLDAPLAVCDARSVGPADLVAADIVYPDRTGEIFEVLYNPAHEWTYFHAMQFDEVLLFKQFDSDAKVARYTPHAAFEHPATPAGTPPRESIEARCLLLYE
ncbi:MAG: CmcJ/NvfI family oxidoreductase [Massilia sp.]